MKTNWKFVLERLVFKFLLTGLQMLKPEQAHALAIKFLKIKYPKAKDVPNHERLKVKFCNIELENPIGLAAGFDKNAEVIPGLFSLGFGFVEIGAATPYPQKGNKKPRLFRLKEDEGIINRLGFNNLGIAHITKKLEIYNGVGTVGLNIGANRNSPDKICDFIDVLSRSAHLVDFLTINVSSPNTEDLRKLQSRKNLIELVRKIKQNYVVKLYKKPILLKIAPDLTNRELKSIIEICQMYEISGIVATNTTTERPNLKSPLQKESGGLSGKPLFEISNQVLAKLYYLSGGKIPLIGVGGIFSGEDAFKKICIGASVVQLYTALTYQGPYLVNSILIKLSHLIEEAGYTNVSEAVGSKNHDYLMKETDRSIFG